MRRRERETKGERRRERDEGRERRRERETKGERDEGRERCGWGMGERERKEKEEGTGGGGGGGGGVVDNLFQRGINYSGIDYPGDNLLRGIIYFVTPAVFDAERRDISNDSVL